MTQALVSLRNFSYNGARMRVVLRDGEPWFVAKDVCEVLEIGDVSSALRRLDDDEKGTDTIPTPGGPQEMAAVNEPGLYVLVMTSRKPEAKTFKRWVTHEVLPSIRRTGAYATPMAIEDLIILQAQSVKELKATVSRLEEAVQIVHHRVDTLDRIDVAGDPRQRLNRMVARYAYDHGYSHRKGWGDFVQGYNTAFRTNLKLLLLNHRSRNGSRSVSIPEYLEAAGRLDDGLRVADKMLNLVQGEVSAK